MMTNKQLRNPKRTSFQALTAPRRKFRRLAPSLALQRRFPLSSSTADQIARPPLLDVLATLFTPTATVGNARAVIMRAGVRPSLRSVGKGLR